MVIVNQNIDGIHVGIDLNNMREFLLSVAQWLDEQSEDEDEHIYGDYNDEHIYGDYNDDLDYVDGYSVDYFGIDYNDGHHY